MSTSPSGVGERVRLVREMVPDLSARELSLLAGQAHSLVAHIERGEIQMPRLDTMQKLGELLDVSLDWLVRGVGDAPETATVQAAIERARAAKPNPSAA